MFDLWQVCPKCKLPKPAADLAEHMTKGACQAPKAGYVLCPLCQTSVKDNEEVGGTDLRGAYHLSLRIPLYTCMHTHICELSPLFSIYLFFFQGWKEHLMGGKCDPSKLTNPFHFGGGYFWSLTFALFS